MIAHPQLETTSNGQSSRTLERLAKAALVLSPYALLAALVIYLTNGGTLKLEDSVWLALALAVAFFVSNRALFD